MYVRQPTEYWESIIFVDESKYNIFGSDATRGLLATDHVILNHGQVTWTTPELAPPLLTTTPHQWEDVSVLDRFNVHRCPTRWVFSGTGLELVTRQATIRYLYHSATATTVKYGRGNQTVWGCIESSGFVNLHFIDGIMNKYVYLELLKRNLKQSVSKLGISGYFKLYQDNDP
ncbi:uncharacterized protein TNCV_3381111 [Trichonephila clavipes]|nr:uncharacterized protein TNCV_3381111 [Trichonephila clavipes]